MVNAARYSFTLAEADFIGLQKAVGRRLTDISSANTKLFFSNLFVWIPLGISFAAYAALFRGHPEISKELTLVAVMLCVGFALMIASAQYKQRMCRKAMLAPDSWFFAEQTVEVDETGLRARGSYGEARYPWSSFRHLAEDEQNLYLFIDNSQALVIPKAAIGSNEGLQQLKGCVSS